MVSVGGRSPPLTSPLAGWVSRNRSPEAPAAAGVQAGSAEPARQLLVDRGVRRYRHLRSERLTGPAELGTEHLTRPAESKLSQHRIKISLLPGGLSPVPTMYGQLGDLLISAAAQQRPAAAGHRDQLVKVSLLPHRQELHCPVPESPRPVLAELISRCLPGRDPPRGRPR